MKTLCELTTQRAYKIGPLFTNMGDKITTTFTQKAYKIHSPTPEYGHRTNYQAQKKR
jgi:hypothetical protein